MIITESNGKERHIEVEILSGLVHYESGDVKAMGVLLKLVELCKKFPPFTTWKLKGRIDNYLIEVKIRRLK